MINVLLIEDHTSLRQALAGIIAASTDLRVVGHRADGDVDGAVAAAEDADVALVDLELPAGHGADVVTALLDMAPTVPSVVLSGLRDDRELGRAVRAGARAVLTKTVEIDEILDALRLVAKGGTLLPEADTQRRLRALDAHVSREQREQAVRETLTAREVEVLEHLAYGLGNAAIAGELGISPETVQTHIRNLIAKLGASSRLEALSLALQYGVVDPP